METYRTEEEQVEAIRRWWDENGRSTMMAIILALVAGFGWQGWKNYDQERSESASHDYQALLQQLASDDAASGGDFSKAKDLAEQIKEQYAGTSYAQFSALQLARLAAMDNKLDEAREQLRWVLAKAPAKSDIADIARLRLARVLASSGDTGKALEILDEGAGGTYAASYAIARGDIYMGLERFDEAREAYTLAKVTLLQTGVNGSIATLDQKLLSLNPVPAREVDVSTKIEVSTTQAAEVTGGESTVVETSDNQEG